MKPVLDTTTFYKISRLFLKKQPIIQHNKKNERKCEQGVIRSVY